MADEVLTNRLYDIVDEITRLGGEQERTSVVPGVLVANANPSDLPTGYIKIVNPKDGGYVPCLTVNGLIVSDNDLLNVLFTKGTEPIALSQSSQSPSNSLKVSEVWESDFGAVALQADANGNIGIGTASPQNALTIQGGAAANVALDMYAGDGDGTDNLNIVLYGVGTPGATTNRERLLIQFRASSNEFRIFTEADGTGTLRPLILETEGNNNQIYLGTGGPVGINTSDVTYTSEGATTTPELIVLREDATNKRGAVFSIISDSGGRTAQNEFIKARVGPAAVTDTVRIGDFFWGGHDGTDYNRSARFGAVVDGSVSANTVPMALVFDTSATNSAGLTERMRIDPGGLIGINGVTAPSTELDIGAGAIEFDEMTAPGGGAANTARLYAVDNGAGKTQLVAVFNTGAAQVLATEP